MEREEVEALIPKGASELTKQQIRYLLQVRARQGRQTDRQTVRLDESNRQTDRQTEL